MRSHHVAGCTVMAGQMPAGRSRVLRLGHAASVALVLLGANAARAQLDVSVDFHASAIGSRNCTLTTSGMSFNGTNAWQMVNNNSSYLSVAFSVSTVPTVSNLTLTHFSSASPSCPGGGYSPVDIIINGTAFLTDYDPASHHGGSHGIVVDSWNIAGRLRSGSNTVKIALKTACSPYCIQLLQVRGGGCVDCPSYDQALTASANWQTASGNFVAGSCLTYRVLVQSGYPVTAKTGCGDGATAAFDTVLEVDNSGCGFVTSNDDGCESSRSEVTWTPTYTGYYYVRVRGYRGTGGSFVMALRQMLPPCPECPDFNESLVAMPDWQTASGVVSPGSCRVYRVSVPFGADVTVKTGCGDGATADFDTLIEVRGRDCAVVPTVDGVCESNHSTVSWRAEYAGDYYVKVLGRDEAGGSFTLAYAAACEAHVQVSPASLTVTCPGASVSGAAAGTGLGGVLSADMAVPAVAGADGCLTISNTGCATLEVGAIEKPSWAALSPAPPYSIVPGGSQEVCVQACDSCAGGDLDGALLIHSNDAGVPTVSVAVHVDCPPLGAPTDCEASPPAVCAGGSSTLVATPGTGGDAVEWFNDSCGGTPVAGGASPTVSPAATTTYYARTKNTGSGDVSPDCCQVTVTVNAVPSAPTGCQANPAAVCFGGSSTLSATPGSDGDAVEWFTGSCGGTPVPGGPSPTVSPTATTTYYARTRNTMSGCVSSNCCQVTVMVRPLPSAPTGCQATPASICAGGSSTLSATAGSGGSAVEWFTEDCGGVPVPGGASPTVSPTTTTTFYARTRNTTTGCVSSSCCQVTVTVNPLPAAPTGCKANPAAMCAGGSSTLSATAGSGGDAVEWFTGSCSGAPVPGGASPTVSPTATTTYYARTRNTTTGCVSSSCCQVTVTVRPLPWAPTACQANPAAICVGGSSVLSATAGSGGSAVDWFTGSCGETPVPGGPSPTVSPTATTTYYARTRNTTTGCVSSSCCQVTVTVHPLPAAPTDCRANPAAICVGGSSTLAATAGSGGDAVEWFTGSCGGTLVPGGSAPTVSPAATTTYFARTRNTTTGCVSSSCCQVTVTVNPLPAAPTDCQADPASICPGGSSVLSATAGSGGDEVEWFTGDCGGTPVPGGASPTVSPTATTTYYARTRNTTTGCVSSSCCQVTITVHAGPAAPTDCQADPSAIWADDSSTLSATAGSGGDAVEWFTDSCGGAPVPGGASPTVSPTETTTYYARTRNTTTGCVSASCCEVTVTVNAAPGAPTGCEANPASICPGGSSVLSATAGSGGDVVEWFTDSCGGAPVPGGSSPTVSPTASTTYYARTKNTGSGAVSAACCQVTVTVSTGPSAPTGCRAAPSTIPPGESSTLSAAAGSGGNTVEWFTDSCGGTPVPGGFSPTVTPATSTTYYARTRNLTTGCVSSSCCEVTVTVDAGPWPPTACQAVPSTVCPGGPSMLSAVPGSGGDTLEWFTDSCGGTPVAGGASPTVNPTATTTYYARTKDTSSGAVSSACCQVTVTVLAGPSGPTGCQANPASICLGGSSTLSAAAGSGGNTVEWVTGGCGGTPVPGGSSPTVSPTVTTTYYARTKNLTTGCVSSICCQVTVTVNSALSAPTNCRAQPDWISPGGSSSLSATPGSGGNAVEWFTDACGGTPVPGGSSPTVSPATTMTYYARTKNTNVGCVSGDCCQLTVTVSAAPAAPTDARANPDTIPPPGCVTLSATPGRGGDTVEWFTESCGGTPVSGGASPSACPTTTTTYYARTKNTSTGAVSETCAQATVTVLQPTNARLFCQPSAQSVAPGGSVALNLFVKRVSDLRGYQTTIAITRTSGSGELEVPCASGVAIDTSRPDYVFQGLASYPASDCPSQRAASALSGGGVNVGETPGYLATYTLDASADAAVGSTFQIAVLPQSDSFLRNSNNDPISFVIDPPCTLTVAAPCLPPSVEASGSRALAVTPDARSAAPVALRVGSEEFSCLSKYVDQNGKLVDLPVYRLPSQWGTMQVSDAALAPQHAYKVCAEMEDGNMSAWSQGVMTWKWGDLNCDAGVDLDDILLALDAFRGAYPSGAALARFDLMACTPNGVIDLDDILAVLDAFGGRAYLCALPCAVGAESGARVAASAAAAEITLAAGRSSVRPGEALTVDVYVGSVTNLRGYQVALRSRGGTSGLLVLESIRIDPQNGSYVFGQGQSFPVVDPANARMASAVIDGGVSTGEAKYLGTYAFRATADAAGEFMVEPADGMLRDSAGGPIAVSGAAGVTVKVGSPGSAPSDMDGDGDVDTADFALFQACLNGPNRGPRHSGCGAADTDEDGDVDLADFIRFQACFNGPNRSPACP